VRCGYLRRDAFDVDVFDVVVAGTGVDPVTSRFSGARSAD
jgi:hypothetical protein